MLTTRHPVDFPCMRPRSGILLLMLTLLLALPGTLPRRWETTVTQTPRPGQTCTARMHPVTKHLEIRCP